MINLNFDPRHIAESYGLGSRETGDFARNCILARRLLERGVRFVQLFSGGPLGGKPRTSWDGHEDMIGNHTREALRIDQPVAALLKDLKQRGMLDDTLVLFTTEFGRTPFTQSASDVLGVGRDHNQYAFSVWLAGAGLRGGGEGHERRRAARQLRAALHAAAHAVGAREPREPRPSTVLLRVGGAGRRDSALAFNGGGGIVCAAAHLPPALATLSSIPCVLNMRDKLSS